MRRRALIGLLVVMGAAHATTVPQPATPERAALSAIDSCIHKLDPAFDVGYQRIAARCPDLARRLDESGWSAWLPRDWKRPGNDVSAASLGELRVAVERELAARPTARAPRVERLHSVLADLEVTHADGWWARFKAWLRDVFERRGQVGEENDLAHMIAAMGLSQTIIELVSYVALVLVVALALLIVVNELRAAGIFRSRLRKRAPENTLEVSTSRRELSWSDVERAGLQNKPGVLLELIATRLAEQRSLAFSQGLTVRELIRAAQLLDQPDRERLAKLASVTECLRYSDRKPPSHSIETALARGRELLDRLSA